MTEHQGVSYIGSGGYPADRLTLLEVDGWRLVKSQHPDITGVDSYPYHIECHSGVFRFNLVASKGTCAMCDSEVPAVIHGLWALHNWETITK